MNMLGRLMNAMGKKTFVVVALALAMIVAGSAKLFWDNSGQVMERNQAFESQLKAMVKATDDAMKADVENALKGVSLHPVEKASIREDLDRLRLNAIGSMNNTLANPSRRLGYGRALVPALLKDSDGAATSMRLQTCFASRYLVARQLHEELLTKSIRSLEGLRSEFTALR